MGIHGALYLALGRSVAMALLLRRQVRLPLSTVLLKFMCGEPVTPADVRAVDPTYYSVCVCVCVCVYVCVLCVVGRVRSANVCCVRTRAATHGSTINATIGRSVMHRTRYAICSGPVGWRSCASC